jgi:hypothetical protein
VGARLTEDDAEQIARSVERGVTRALSRIVAWLLLGAATIFVAPILIGTGLGQFRGASSPNQWAGAVLAILTLVAIILAWYLLLRSARADRR